MDFNLNQSDADTFIGSEIKLTTPKADFGTAQPKPILLNYLSYISFYVVLMYLFFRVERMKEKHY